MPNPKGAPGPQTTDSDSSPSLSRRRYLGWSAAGLGAGLLQACGGGGGGPAAGINPPQAVPATVAWGRQAIGQALAQSGSVTTSVSGAMMIDDSVVWSQAFGTANSDTGALATTSTRFNIGSVSKVFAALCVMIMRDRRLLSLDQPVVQVLPAFSMLSPAYTHVTVRQLVFHAPGFPGVNFRNVFGFAPIPGYAQDTLKSLALSHLKHDPGELSVYCNDGFTMVELLVLQLTGRSYTDFVQQEIFGPLGMTLSGFALAPAAEGTFAHASYEGRMQPQEFPSAFATGGVVSTPSDMMKLASMFIDAGMYNGQRIVSADGLQQMGINQVSSTRINLTTAFRPGLGWDTVKQMGLEAGGLHGWAKNGDTIFFSSEFFVLPEARMAMMITGNGHDFGPKALTEGMVLRAAVERGVIATMPPALVPTVPARGSSSTPVAQLAGVYANHSAPLQVVVAADGSLTVRRWVAGAWTVEQAGLQPRSDGRWWADAQTKVSYSFVSASGNRYLMRQRLSDSALYWDEEPVGQWLPPLSTPLSAAWQARVGSSWLCTNDDPQSVEAKLGPRIWNLGVMAEMPGYILWDDAQLLSIVDDNQTGMNLKIPVNAGRELVELRMVMAGSVEEMHCGTLVFRRMS